ncbi:hypothetical protein GOP47_0015166 [Adiantum capillus-veneris]|uniref:Uncharacterized protein n=1 Tax=Adiantum capillus-veneris TaxID=13818 RepID=A0A9D4ZCU3_ADICA|nr:hypothetical protein GOP47_0015166 [Adiantum capillus-veneris]
MAWLGNYEIGSLFLPERASGRQLAVLALPVVPLLAEVALTCIICRGYLSKLDKTQCIPTSIKSILLVNAFLTFILLCNTLAEGAIMSFTIQVESLLLEYGGSWLQRRADEWGAAAKAGDNVLDRTTQGLVWVVVVVYVSAVSFVALRVKGCENGSSTWSLQAYWKIMSVVVYRSKWVAVCFLLIFSG